MKVCITGGCGFIGSHIVDAYVEAGHDVTVIDNLSSGKRGNLNKKARLFVVDICSAEIEEIFSSERFDLINHHAAQISVPFSVKEPLLDAEINIKGTIRLLGLSRKYNLKRFIFASTGGAIYGDATVIPTDETYMPEPASPYAISKLSCEKYILYYSAQLGLPYTILRYSNVFGPRQIPHGEAGVVAIFTELLLAGKRPVLYHYGDEPDGMVRDYCYVKDVVRASMLATTNEKNGIFNVATGKPTNTIELYRLIVMILRERGYPIPVEYNEPLRVLAEPGNVRVSTLNAEKAGNELQWKPRHTLAEGLRETIEWYSGLEA